MAPGQGIQIKDRILRSSVRRALDVIGDRWTLLVVLGAFYGFSRFDDWLQHYRMSSSVLSDRLKRLQRKGILIKEPIEGSRRQRYVLNDAGRELFPWAVAVWHWEQLWLYPDTGHPVSMIHTLCGSATTPTYTCIHCEEPVKWTDVKVAEGPGIRSRESSRSPNSRRSTVSTDSGEGGRNFGRIADIFGDRWSYLIISASYYKIRRFDDYQNQLDIAPSILSDRLKRLVDHGILAKSCYQERPARWEYIQTEKTFDFGMVALMLGLWGDKWLPLAAGPTILRLHAHCGKLVGIRLDCAACQKELTRENVLFRDSGPRSLPGE